MYAKDLSIIIPSRNEEFLARTVQDILENIEADTDVIAFLDGAWAEPPVEQHERVNVIHANNPVGQRAGANIAASISRAKYVMKVDAHCSFDKGFDRKMIEGFKMGENNIMVPVMRNLHAFSWVCPCGHEVYQSPTPGTPNAKVDRCPDCDKFEWKKEIKWIGKERPQSVSYCFDSEPHFQYFNEYKKTDKYKEELKTGFTETMSLQGSCFMLTRENYWKWRICDEKVGNWGNQGIEVACKGWLSGNKVLVNHNTWYAHMFRTQGGDFSFPWPASGNDAQKTKKKVTDLFWGNKWEHKKKPLKWLVERFNPPGWTEEQLAQLPDLKV